VTRFVAVLAALACVQCGPKVRMVARDAPVPWKASGIDWTTPPPLGTPVPFAPPAAKTFVLKNGLRVIVVANGRLPLVAMAMVNEGAGSREDGDKPGLAALTAELLDEGAGKRTAAEVRDALALGGARLEVHIATDYASLEVVAPTRNAVSNLVLLANMIVAPRFDAADVARVRGERVAEIEVREQRPRTIAAQVFDRVVFGAHPYALPAEGDAKTVAALTADDVQRFWARAYRPETTTLILAGDINAWGVRDDIERAFGGWNVRQGTGTGAATGTGTGAATGTGTATGTATGPTPAGPPLARHAAQLALVDMPGARQSVVLIGRRAAAAGDEQQLVDDVASSIVGGGFGARLDRELHEELGLTLGASASYWRGRWAGSWALATTFATDKTLAGIRAALAVLDKARTDISADELATAKTNLVAAAQLSFETTSATARAIERLVAQGLPIDSYVTYAKRLAAVTLADVRAASAWSDLSLVVVGDRAKVEPVLSDLALPITHYDRDGTKQ